MRVVDRKRWEIFSCEDIKLSQRLKTQLNTVRQSWYERFFEAAHLQSMSYRGCIVPLKPGDRLIAKAYQSKHPLRDKRLHVVPI